MNRRLLVVLVALYPPAWRRRYGAEVAEIAARETAGALTTWMATADLFRGAGAEWCRVAGLVGAPVTRRDRAIGGWVAVLWSWAMFVVAGCVLQKGSEHWQSAVAAPARGGPEAAFAVLVATAVLAGVGVLSAAAIVVPAARRALASGAWVWVRAPVRAATALTAVTVIGAVAVIGWAHGLSTTARNGADPAYAAAVLVLVACVVATVGAWCISVSRLLRIAIPGSAVVAAEGVLAVVVAAAMLVTTAAAVVWWGLIGHDAAPAVAGAIGAMALASVAAVAGATRAAGMLHAHH